jgi:hypothetical protein
VQTVVAKDCTDLTFSQTRSLPDVVRTMNDLYARHGNRVVGLQRHAGMVSFTCKRDGQPMRGEYLALTQIATTQDTGGLWQVVFLYGYLAPQYRAAEAEEILGRVVKSYTPNPEWEQMQTNIAAGTSKIVTETNEVISGILRDAYANHTKTGDEAMRHWSNAMLGVTDVEDPDTGERWNVAAGRNYYWRKVGADTVVGTQTADRPNIDFSPLREW